MPASLAELVGKQARRWRFQHLHRLERLRRVWPEAAGEYVAQHASPVRLMRGSLRLAVADAAWAAELTYLIPEILERLNTLVPIGWVKEIKVVQGEVLPCGAKSESDNLVLAKASPAMKQAAAELGEQVADENLGDAIRRARLAALRRLDAKGGPG